MSSKTDFYDEQISKLESLLANGTDSQKKKAIQSTIAVFRKEMEDLFPSLTYNNGESLFSKSETVDLDFDLTILIDRLKKLKAESSDKNSTEADVIVNNNLVVAISFEQTLQNIKSANCTNTEKEEMETKLTELENSKKNKTEFWKKAASILKWSIERGIEVFKIFAPYILKNIS